MSLTNPFQIRQVRVFTTVWFLTLVIVSTLESGQAFYTGEWTNIQVQGRDSYSKQPEPTGLYLYPSYSPMCNVLVYPHHWWLNSEISDTMDIEVKLVNNQTVPYPITDYPEQWIQFELYTNYTSVVMNSPIKEGTEIGSRFIGWRKKEEGLIVPPTSVPPNNDEYSLLFAVWNHTEGVSLMGIKPTGSTPGNVTVTNWLTDASVKDNVKDQKDTLNTLFYIGTRYLQREDNSIATQWTDSLLARNPTSIIAWVLKSYILDRDSSRSEALIAIDHTLWIMEEGLDPCIPYKRDFWLSELPETEYTWISEMYKRMIRLRKWVESYHKVFSK